MAVQAAEFLSTEQAARLLQVHPKTVERLLREGKIPEQKVGRAWRVHRLELDRYVRGAA